MAAGLSIATSMGAQAAYATNVAFTDEVAVSIPKGTTSLGLGLKDENYRGSIRIVVQSVKDGAPRTVEENVKPGFLLSAIDGKNVEGYGVKRAVEILKKALEDGGSISLIYRDPTAFIRALDSRDPRSPSIVTTRVLPENKGTRGGEYRDQVLSVERVEIGSRQGIVADVGDVLEVSFQLRLKENGDEVIDGVEKVEAAGSSYGGSQNMFFVLGSGKYDNPILGPNGRDDILPPGWDMYTRGMLVDELRRITIPPVMGIGAKGYHPTKSLSSATQGGVKVEGDLRRGNVVARREENSDAKVSLDALLKQYPTSDLVLDVRLLTINGER